MSTHHRSERRAWLIAWVLALALHAVGVLGFRSFPLLHADRVAQVSHEPEPIHLVFSSATPAETRKSEEPHFFSELPPNRADAAPKKADYLSNVTSRARDLVPGGDAALPRMHGEGDAPMVRLDPDGNPQRPAAPAPQQTEPSVPRPTDSTRPSDAAMKTGSGEAPPPTPNSVPAQPPSNAAQGAPGSAGSSDIHQPEMDNPDGNAALTGDVSLNTTAWDYAPWLQRTAA